MAFIATRSRVHSSQQRNCARHQQRLNEHIHTQNTIQPCRSSSAIMIFVIIIIIIINDNYIVAYICNMFIRIYQQQSATTNRLSVIS